MQIHILNFFNSYTLKQVIFSIFLSFSVFFLCQTQYYQKINIEKENSMEKIVMPGEDGYSNKK